MFGLGIACAGAAGVALAMIFPFSPNTQVQWLAWAFLVVILGGLGNVANTLVAGLVVGLIQTSCTAFMPFDYVYLVLYVLLAVILVVRREGLERRGPPYDLGGAVVLCLFPAVDEERLAPRALGLGAVGDACSSHCRSTAHLRPAALHSQHARHRFSSTWC